MLSCGANRALPMPARCNQREFPINRCHQQVVSGIGGKPRARFSRYGFQSIGVTNEW